MRDYSYVCFKLISRPLVYPNKLLHGYATMKINICLFLFGSLSLSDGLCKELLIHIF